MRRERAIHQPARCAVALQRCLARARGEPGRDVRAPRAPVRVQADRVGHVPGLSVLNGGRGPVYVPPVLMGLKVRDLKPGPGLEMLPTSGSGGRAKRHRNQNDNSRPGAVGFSTRIGSTSSRVVGYIVPTRNITLIA